MREIDIDMPGIDDVAMVIQCVESVLRSTGLTLHTRGSLRKYPGCVHWHFRNGKHPGTLEVTLWPARRRLWFKVQSRRAAPWIDQLVPALKAALEKG